MKRLFFITFTSIIFSTVFAAPVNTAVSNGFWNQTGIWSLGRLPQDGDTVVIPSDKKVTIANNQNLPAEFLYIKVAGILDLNGGKISVNNSSIIVVLTDGIISGNGNASETIKIGGAEKFVGTSSDVVGPQMASAITTGFTNFNGAVLPVKFLGFNITRNNKDVLVQWSTSEEHNAKSYEVERSENGNGWIAIASLNAAGNSSITNNYSYTDGGITAKTVYYRVKQIDLDGRFVYTPVRSLKNENADARVKVIASQSKLVLQFSQTLTEPVEVNVVSMNGQLINKQTVNNPMGQYILNLDGSLKGNYVVSVSNGKGMNIAQKVVL